MERKWTWPLGDYTRHGKLREDEYDLAPLTRMHEHNISDRDSPALQNINSEK